MGYAVSVTELTVKGLRDVLEAISWRVVLDEHYRRNPQARPSLVEVAKAAAAIDDNPIAEKPDLIEQAAIWVAEHRPGANADDVLWLATGMSLARAIA
jgi:P2-related tail formation protein